MVSNPNIWVLLSETNRIIKGHSGHFLTLSIIFLLPISSSFFLLFSQLLNHDPTSVTPTTPLFFYQLLYSLFLMFFSFCSVSTITYSVFHAFYNQPFNLLSSIKSILTSFFPLLATTIVLKVIVFFISFFFSLLLFLIILGTHLVGITISYSSPYLIGFSAALVLLPLLFVVIYLQVNWILVPVIVVVEKCWGLEPLRRSASLMKGMKKVAVSLLFLFGFFEGILVWSGPVSRLLTMGSDGIPISNFDWVNILLLIMGKSLLLMMFLLLNTAANAVLYIFCKGIHGENAEEFGKKDYVSYVPLVVSALDV